MYEYGEIIFENSGRMTMEQLAEETLGQEITQKEFWESALIPLRDAIEEYLNLTEKMMKPI